MKTRPYIIVPNLIDQPTWGGDYIASLKKLTGNKLSKLKVGQSYELFEESRLSTLQSTKKSPSIELGNPKDPTQTEKVFNPSDKPFAIQKLIDQDPVAILGSKATKLHGQKIQVLIKLTQALGNSFQIHVKQPTDGWVPKPESWYYFEPGLVTLGIKPGADWDKYEKSCRKIYKHSEQISKQIKSGKLTLEEGRVQLQQTIAADHPDQYVNLVATKKDASLDLSPCGIHHSWEENPKTHPGGNILYEVQKNVYDPVSTIRSFDKGKIKDDGSIRELQLDAYFKHIDRSKQANNPDNHFTKQKIIKRTSTYTLRHIFDTKDYQMQKLTINKPLQNKYTTTTDSYHHLFVKSGNIHIKTKSSKLTLTTGYSAFIPANTGEYQISPTGNPTATILKTFL